MRVFIAISPPEETTSKVGNLIDTLKPKFPLVKWEAPGKVHLTIVFFGVLNREKVTNLRKTLQNFTATQKSLSVKIGNLSYFYKKSQDSIISLEIEDESHELRNFYKNLKIKLEEAGFYPPERLSPHLTIGRVKRTRFPHDVKRTLIEILATETSPVGEFEVTSLGLFESTYSKNANTSQYHTIETFPLGSGVST